VQKVRLGLAALVTGVWLVGYVLSYTNGTQPPTELSGLMAVVLGWAFAGQVRESLKRKDNGHDR
jgi:thiol:disulfide interchange protein